MTHQQEVNAAIDRAKEEEWNTRTSGTVSAQAFDDRRLLAVEVVLLREAVAGLQSDLSDCRSEMQEALREAGADLRNAHQEMDAMEDAIARGEYWG